MKYTYSPDEYRKLQIEYYDLEYIKNHKKEVRKLLEEFNIIKRHPSNFEEFSRDWLYIDEKLKCIHDCALTHHLWHNETNGRKEIYYRVYVFNKI